MSTPFSDTYAEARQKFLSLAHERDAKVVSVVHPTARGAQGEELAIDVATFGHTAQKRPCSLYPGLTGKRVSSDPGSRSSSSVIWRSPNV